jgi:IS5 family transposase
VAGLLYLEHAFKVSDERVVEQWLESPYWQYFCGETFFQHEFPCDPSSLTRWRQRLGEEGCEWLLTATIDAGLKSKLVKPSSLKRVVIDTTVQEKNIRFPTDSQLQNQSRKQLVALAHELGISLRQTYQKQSRFLLPKIGRYAHARQFKRMRKALKKIKNALGCVHRDLLRKIRSDMYLSKAQVNVLFYAERLLNQQKHSKHKLYSLHAPEAECLSKGKAHKRYEFGVKASFATTLRECFVVGARSFAGNPYDGHTLSEQLEQVKTLCNDKPIDEAHVDRYAFTPNLALCA